MTAPVEPVHARTPRVAPAPAVCSGGEREVRELKDTLSIDAYITLGTPATDALAASLTALFERYKAAAPQRFVFRVVDGRTAYGAQEATAAGLSPQSLEPSAREESTPDAVTVISGLVLRYAGKGETLKFLPPEAKYGVEFRVIEKIRAVRARAEGTVYAIGLSSGHGELSLREPNLVPRASGDLTIAKVIELNFPYYSMPDVDLRAAASRTQLAGLIITEPAQDLDDATLARIDELVMAGTPVAILSSAVHVHPGDATMLATLVTRRLDKLLSAYGVDLHEDVVLDYGKSFSVAVMTSAAHMQTVYFPAFPKVVADPRFTGYEELLDGTHQAFFMLLSLSFPLASSLSLDPKKQPEALLRVLARSTPYAVAKTKNPVSLAPFQRWEPNGVREQMTLAVEVSGTIQSAFVPKKHSVNGARVLVVSSSHVLANPLMIASASSDAGTGLHYENPANSTMADLAGPYAQGALPSAILMFKNVLDWMSTPADVRACVPLTP